MWPTGVGSRLPCPRDSALRRAALGGNVLAVSPHHIPTGRSVRVFISANPDDTEAERSALKEHVYPKLREFCRENYGIEFQVVDLYWGIDPEEWDNPELQRMRMKLLEECLKTSSGPCFVGLLGEKYGSIRIPGEVESAEFEMILDSATEAGLDTRILEECYCRDENAVPPAYYLKPKSEILKNLHNSMESANRNLQNDKSWQNIADGIKKVFKTAVSLLQEKGTMKNSQAKRFLCSETVYIWSVAEESICRRVQLPNNFLKTLEDFQISPNGKLGIVSRGDENINILDLHSGKLRIVHASGVLWRQRLSRDGRYLVYICFQNSDDDDDSGVVSNLTVMRLADGKSIGACSLYKTPTFFSLSQRHLNIIVGFDDGSIGTYTVVDRVDAALKIKIATSNSRQIVNNASQKVRPKCATHSCKTIADCVWRESTEVFSRESPINVSDSGETEATPTKKQNCCHDRVCSDN
nr:PREDICTED: NACHT and WD repeat domain-containing protein 2 isoform X3 [Lepisosteus oculatus]